MKKFPERKNLNLATVAEEILKKWESENTFEKSISSKPEDNPFVFYEGPPSSNGLPGIHHVMARSIKDVFCRFKTLKGFRVNRKAGWDTHGLPVELGVEKELGITKDDIGKTISVEEYNIACKKAVMKYTDIWNNLTQKMGYWVDMKNPYITYENKYIESVWWLIKQAFDKDLIYKGYTIQPFSPKAGTGLSSHELNQPGCYKMVKDTSVTAQFLFTGEVSPFVVKESVFFIAWTTTPWTLPSNTALAINRNFTYVLVETTNQYTKLPIYVVLAEKLVSKVFSGPYIEADSLTNNNKQIGYKVIQKLKGEEIENLKYQQLIDLAKPYENAQNAFKTIHADFVSTEDGTGIVHIAPTFGADDAKAALENNIPGILLKNEDDSLIPLVNQKGQFVNGLGELSGKFVKNEYYPNGEAPEKSVDIEIAINLKEQNRAFKVEKYDHSYPHCWRTDKPVLYYPLDSWFIKVSEFKSEMTELNKQINWKPKSTGTGRFGNWLSNANDWNLSRSRFWGIPIPIWRTEDKKETICIGSIEELQKHIAISVKNGLMISNPLEGFELNNFSDDNYTFFDLHRNFVDKIILCGSSGKPMYRENDLIDVWFDSGSMPFAQWHYPFENKALIDDSKVFPADFIAEGVDQTRGWFYTLHAIATMTKKSIAYKNVISNGLVLDKNGLKMSKRLGNAVDPFETLDKYGADATRWYMITNAQPWDNLKFDLAGIEEVKRKFFGTLFNVYSFFSLYANLDNYSFKEVSSKNLTEIDLWIISKLNTLSYEVNQAYETYEPTKAGRLIQKFVTDDLSNWYVRLCRKRFWKGDLNPDKKAAYDTLYVCLRNVSLLISPIAPFYSDLLFRDLTNDGASVHLQSFPEADSSLIDIDLEQKVELSQRLSSLILSIRKKKKIKVRQPLSRVLIPSEGADFEKAINEVKSLILTEVNVKEVSFIEKNDPLLKKKAKANFKLLGPRYGKQMKSISSIIGDWKSDEISAFEQSDHYEIAVEGGVVMLEKNDVDILTDDVPGWEIASDGNITVALDLVITQELKEEGLSRDLVNRIQNVRKELDFEVMDNIEIKIVTNNDFKIAINNNLNYICSETLATKLVHVSNIDNPYFVGDDNTLQFSIKKIKQLSKNE
ncbi:MAG: isoleucine--tRNA ligase [Parvicellaceae bacterium]